MSYKSKEQQKQYSHEWYLNHKDITRERAKLWKRKRRMMNKAAITVSTENTTLSPHDFYLVLKRNVCEGLSPQWTEEVRTYFYKELNRRVAVVYFELTGKELNGCVKTSFL